ncbi:MAG TPA: hypothetical protein VF615_21275 [Longimicrobiaceae bacterium]|jgi:hypothetical protein
MRPIHLFTALLATSLSACATVRNEQAVRDLEPRPVAASRDPVNQRARSMVDGLVLALTIDSTSIHLDRVTLARIPRPARQRGGAAGGDRVTAAGFAGGVRVSEATAPDAVLNTQEGVGLVRLTRRQVVLSLPAPRALDMVEVSAPATGAAARLDVSAAYAPYCREYRRENKYCPSPRSPGPVR